MEIINREYYDGLLAELQVELKALRNFPVNTTPASRHLELMAVSLALGEGYSMFQDDPEHCAVTMYAVLIGYYKAKASAVSGDRSDGDASSVAR